MCLNNKWVTIMMMWSLHMVILTLPAKYIGLALLMLFILIIWHKIYSFNKFMRENTKLAEDYKKNPESTQELYDQSIETRVTAMMEANKKK